MSGIRSDCSRTSAGQDVASVSRGTGPGHSWACCSMQDGLLRTRGEYAIAHKLLDEAPLCDAPRGKFWKEGHREISGT